MTGVTRDLPALLDHTGHAQLVGGKHDGRTYVLGSFDGESYWTRVGDWWCDELDIAAIERDAAAAGGRVAAVLPPDAPEPPVGAEIIIQFDGWGAKLRHWDNGWSADRILRPDQWATMFGKGERFVELVAIPVTEQQPGAPSEPVEHLGRASDAPSLVEARQLTDDDADWGAFARWCDAYDRHHPDEGWLIVVPGAGAARIGDWVVRGEDGMFTVVPGRHADAILRSHRGNA